jgi:hypothetical protein
MMHPDQHDKVRRMKDDDNPLALFGLFAAAGSGFIVGFAIC